MLVGSIAVALLASTGTIVRPDVTLHYYTVGSGKPLVILSGGPGFDVRYMQPVADELGKERECIMFEQRGTGLSKMAVLDKNTLTVAKYVEDLEALRQELHLDKLDLLGHSWGGCLAMEYAVNHPDHTGSVVLVDSAGPDWSFYDPFSKNLRARLSPGDRYASAYWSAPERKGLDPLYLSAKSVKAVAPGYFSGRGAAMRFAEGIQPGAITPGITGTVFSELRQSYDIRSRLRSLHVPFLVVHGENDPLPIATGKGIADMVPGSRFVAVQNSGHFPWLENPGACYPAIEDFLRS